MDQGLSDRTFRFRLPTWRRIGNPIVAVMELTYAALAVLAYAHIAARLSSAPGGGIPVPPRLTWTLLGGAALWLVAAILTVRRVFLDRRLEQMGEVHVTRVSLVLSERLGDSESIFWEDVEELRILGLSEATEDSDLRLDIRGAGRRIRVPFFVQENQLLREHIIQRAGLTEKKQTFLTTRFLRPRGEGD